MPLQAFAISSVRGVQELTDTFLFANLYFWSGYAFGSLIDGVADPPPADNTDGDAPSEGYATLLVFLQVTLISFVYMYGVHVLHKLENPLWRLPGIPRGGYEPLYWHSIHDGLFFALGLCWATPTLTGQLGRLTRNR